MRIFAHQHTCAHKNDETTGTDHLDYSISMISLMPVEATGEGYTGNAGEPH